MAKLLALILVLANIALATSFLVSRQADAGAAITTAINNITTYTNDLDDQILKFSLKTATQLQDATDVLIQTIQIGIDNVRPTGNLTSAETLNLATPITALQKAVNTTVTNIIAAKPQLGGLGFVVQQSLAQQENLTTVFSTLILARIPQNLSSVAASLSAPIFNSLNQGIAAFQNLTPNDVSSYPSAAFQVAPSSVYNLITVAGITFAATWAFSGGLLA